MKTIESEPTNGGTQLKIAALIFGFVLALSFHGYLSRPTLDLYEDMYENYAWGVTWQWGYFKHPPFFAWETALWFKLFPKSDFSYFFFTALNSGVALAALWRIAARFGGGGFQLLVVVLAMVMPPISFLALNFNANSAMTPLWALLFLFYLRGLEKGNLLDAVCIGLLAAASMLTKYHSAVMLAALLFHALLDREARVKLFSLFGLTAAIVFCVFIAPHIYWLFENDFRPLTYAASQNDGAGPNIADTALFLVTPLGYGALSILIARMMRDLRDGYDFVPLAELKRLAARVDGRALIAFAALPILLTVCLGWIADAELSAVWGIPFYTAYAVIIALLVPPAYFDERKTRAMAAGLTFMVIIIVIAPFWYQVEIRRDAGFYTAPLRSVAQELDKRWSYPVSDEGPVIIGTLPLSNAVSFYSKLNAVALEANAFEVTEKFLTRSDARRRGIVGVCWDKDSGCIARVKAEVPPLLQPEIFTLPGFAPGSTWTFNIWMTPPAP